MKPVALYCRCSTSAQSLNIQLNDLTRYAQARGFEVVEVYQDHGVSGAKDSRPALDRMLKAARQRKFATVLVWRLDRLGRNTRHLLNLVEEFESLGVSLISYSEAFDLSTPVGRVVLTVLSALSAFERDLIRERVISGIEAAKKKGIRLGRPPTVDHQAIRQLRADGRTYAQITDTLKVSAGAIRDALRVKL